MRIIFLRKEYLSLLPSMIASLFSVNSVAEVLDSCQGYDIKASCQASRQSLSGITQDWSIADGQWVIFSGMANNASGGAVFLQQSAEFTISPQNETGMTLFSNNSISGEYNNGGAIFAKENSTINLANVIFDSNVAGGYGGAIYSAGTNDAGDMDLNITNAIFANNIANDGKGGAIYSINNDIYLSDVIFDNNQAYTSTSYSDGDGGAIDVTDNSTDNTHLSGKTIINNTSFTNNYAEGYGGAIYTSSTTSPYLIDISVDDNYDQNNGVMIDENNSASGYDHSATAAAGGFMYIGHSVAEFNIAADKTLVIGNTSNDGAIDSLAGTGVIVKEGAGELVLNADNNAFTGEMSIQNGEVTLGRSDELMNVGDTHCQSDPQDCFGLMVGSTVHSEYQAELNVGNTQQTFVHSLTGFANGILNIDAGGNVTVNQGGFSGSIQGEGQLTVAQDGSYLLTGAQSMALTGDIVVEDNAVLSLAGNQADLRAMQSDPQSIVLNGGVLDLSDFTTWDGDSSYNDGLQISGSGGTVIGSNDVVDISSGDDLHIGGSDASQNGVYVVINAGDQRVTLANNNGYLGNTQIASGTLEVSDNSQLGDTSYNRSVIFTDPQQHSEMDVTTDVDTRSATTGQGRNIEMRADGEIHVEDGVDTQWGGLMADSTGQQLDSWLQYAWFNNDISEHEDGADHYHSSGIIASLEAGYQWLPGHGVVIEPQAQVIYQGVQQDDFTAANHARVSQSQGDDIQTRLGLHSEWRTAVGVIPTLDLNYYHDPHATEIEEDGSTISDDAVKQRGEIKVGITGNISQRVSLRGSVAWQKGSDDFAQTAGFLSMTVKW
ncbi:autotransporter outer membrane beta-barrel domain-containing protein [Escherichia coli]